MKRLLESFLRDLEPHFSGEICQSLGQRLVYATDNSIFQLIPEAILFPKCQEDITETLHLMSLPQYQGLNLVARGGGTSTNGQSLGNCLVLDVSKYMNKCLEIDTNNQRVVVEPGIVLDKLNAILGKEGFFFPPEISPSNRATLGGMVNTDASGQGSTAYGKTGDSIISVHFYTLGGALWRISREKTELLESKNQQQEHFFTELSDKLAKSLEPQKNRVETKFPKLPRSITGYNLLGFYQSDYRDFLSLIVGSEGSLGVVSKIEISIQPLPQSKVLILCEYQNFLDALRANEYILEIQPTAVETLDDNILNLAKSDIIWQKTKRYFQSENSHKTQAINLIELAGTHEQVADKLEKAKKCLETHQDKHLGYSIYSDAVEIAHLWALRKKGVGLLGKLKGERKPVAFMEDTAVPPAHLVAYVSQVRKLLDTHHLKYGMFGHIDAGCLHIRPALNLRLENDFALYKQLSLEVYNLVMQFGGVFWGEHGKGFRSEMVPEFFGAEIYSIFQKLKAYFDPHNQLNPGKIATPSPSFQLTKLKEASYRAQYDRQAKEDIISKNASIFQCNGNAQCFNYDWQDYMCPSYKVSGNRLYSPKGRAMLTKVWLHNLSASSSVESKQDAKNYPLDNEQEFYDEVYDAMNACLGCKACATECPIEINIPHYKAEFLHFYHKTKLRPLRDYLVAYLEEFLLVAYKFPRFSGFLLSLNLTSLLMKAIGFVKLPKIETHNLPAIDQHKQIESQGVASEADVLILRDVFTSLFTPEVALCLFRLLEFFGAKAGFAELLINGKSKHVKGFLDSFLKKVQANQHKFQSYNAQHVIGIDPSMSLCFRDEYQKAAEKLSLDTRATIFQVQTLSEFLSDFLRSCHKTENVGVQKMLSLPCTSKESRLHSSNTDINEDLNSCVHRNDGKICNSLLHDESQQDKLQILKQQISSTPEKLVLFLHCTEATQTPASAANWTEIFALLGKNLEIAKTGCCGMAGIYGHESQHQQDSQDLFRASWKNQLDYWQEQGYTILVTGYSCREQVLCESNATPLHPLEFITHKIKFY